MFRPYKVIIRPSKKTDPRAVLCSTALWGLKCIWDPTMQWNIIQLLDLSSWRAWWWPCKVKTCRPDKCTVSLYINKVLCYRLTCCIYMLQHFGMGNIKFAPRMYNHSCYRSCCSYCSPEFSARYFSRWSNTCIHYQSKHNSLTLWRLTTYISRTAPLTSKRCVLYIYSTNVGTEYFKHALYSPFFFLQNAVCFIMLNCLVPVLFTFYIQSVLKLKKIIPAPKG